MNYGTREINIFRTDVIKLKIKLICFLIKIMMNKKYIY